MRIQNAVSNSVFTQLHALEDSLNQLGDLLQRENQALQKKDANQLKNIAAQKDDCLTSLGKQYENFLESCNIQKDIKSHDEIISLLEKITDKSENLRQQWGSLREKVNRCNLQNMINGMIIFTLKNHNEHLLSLLTNKEKSTMYNQQAQLNNQLPSTKSILIK